MCTFSSFSSCFFCCSSNFFHHGSYGVADHVDGKMRRSSWGSRARRKVSTLTPSAAASWGPCMVLRMDTEPARNSGFFSLAEVEKPNNSKAPSFDAIWHKGKDFGTTNTSPSLISVLIALLPFGYTIWTSPHPFTTMLYSVALGFTWGPNMDPCSSKVDLTTSQLTYINS